MNTRYLTDKIRLAFPPDRDAVRGAHLAAVIESSLDAIVSMSLTGHIQSWNAGATALYGYQPDEVLGLPILLIVPEELHDEEQRLLQRIRAGERIAHFDTIRKSRDGRRVPISLTISPIRDATGAVIGASKIARDISERKFSEKLLAAEFETIAKLNELSSRLWRSRALSAGLHEMLVAVMELLSADKGNIQILDSQRQVLSIAAHKGFQPEYLDFFREVSAQDDSACGRALRCRQRTVIEDIELDRDYEPLRSLARAAGYRAVISSPLISSDGTVLGAVSTHFSSVHRPTDLELRRLDLYLRQASDFIQRCHMEEALQLSKAALLEADRRKDDFLALLAHELRNPLAPIRYAIASVRSAPASAAQRARTDEVIERQVTHMSRLLDDLLDVSRIAMDRLELKQAPIELKHVLDAAIEASRPGMEAKRHTLSLCLPAQPIWLMADAVRLTQVFSNLLVNAAKYTNSGGTVVLSAGAEGGKITVSVRDDGVGIARETLPRLFVPFFQGDAVRWRTEGGLGIGLSLARGLVTLHGGTIEAFSEGPGKGSEFVVQLPAMDRPAAEPVNAHDSEHTQSRPGRAVRVLLVDDNRDAADTCATLLELAGQDVRVAYSGRGALEVAEDFRPHLVLLDIGLPDLDGYEVARLIREAEWGKEAVLVAATGWGRENDKQRAFAAGFNHHRTKPIAGEDLLALVRSFDELRAP